MDRRPRIAVLVPTSSHYGREVLHGIAAFTRRQQPWTFARYPWSLADDSFVARLAPCDGVIAMAGRKFYSRVRAPAALPWVCVADVFDVAGPAVMSDNPAVGRRAAEHLLGCGLRRFAFCGYPTVLYSDQRLAGFRTALEAAGHEVSICPLPPTRIGSRRNVTGEQRAIETWLRSLTPPVGVFAAADSRAAAVTAVCAEIGYRVPDEVAVVGVDNDDLVCELTSPPLSSVEMNPRRIGFEGAALLLRLLQVQPPPTDPVLIEPQGVIKRQSTDTFAAEEPGVAEALRYLRQHACDGIGVSDVVRVVPVARRTLEKVSRRVLGRSPLQEIRRLQLERATELLRSTDLRISQIAQAAGLRDGKYLADVFHRELGISPSAYRRQSREMYGPGHAPPRA